MDTIPKTAPGGQIMQRLSEAGYKITESRRAVVELVLQHEANFSAADIYADVQEQAPSVGRATVFRTIELLASMNLLEKIHVGDGCHRYVVCHEHHHHHLICNSCGAAVEINDCRLDEMLAQLERETHYQIRGHWLEVFGQCQNCQKTPATSRLVSNLC